MFIQRPLMQIENVSSVVGALPEAEKRKTIVSVTPVAVADDSRTLKMAVSFATAGYRSIVAEGRPSNRDFSEIGISVISLHEMPHVCDDGVPEDVASKYVELPNASPASKTNGFRDIARALYRLIGRSPLHSMRDLWTLYLHLGTLWVSNRESSARLPGADLYYVHAFDYAPALLLRCILQRTPIIYDAHDLYQDLVLARNPNRFVRRYVARINRLFERMLAARANVRVTTSEAMAGALERDYKRRFDVVLNLHDSRLDFPADTVTGIRERLSLPENCLVLVSIGNVKEAHDFSGVASALAKADGRIHFVGVGSGYDAVAVCFAQAGARDSFHAAGRLAAREIVPALRDADGAILPYRPLREAYETFLPNGFGQAIAAGLPLLYPRNIPAVARHAQAQNLGWPIDPSQTNEVEAAVAAFENLEQREAIASNVRTFAQTFNWAHEEQKLIALVDRALAA